MRDAQHILHAKGLAALNIERTEPQHGEYYEVRGRYVRMGDPLPVVVVPTETRDTRPSCEAVQSTPLRHFALCGFVLGILVAMYLNGGF